MNAFSTRQNAGNTRGAPAISHDHKPCKGLHSNWRSLLQLFANVVIAPKTQNYQSKGQLDAKRWYAMQCAIRARPSIALDLAQMAKSAPRELPFRLTALDSWRIAVDILHARKAASKAGK
ncbi:hypothetical protein [Pseudomonas carassii]|uniref:Uncharacterized protein n=1 Tax=Pseudomonas carassii TaxID=3115855 RepID=A0ABU7H4R5_9PSED|nr:hypothetical protein [Pseudomonas sp. 137P]MEE1886218.1 hypothetical protein [Pseudomonas sp. 137P]